MRHNRIRQTFETPVGNEINLFRNAFRGRNIKAKVVVCCKINARAAELARKNTIRLVKNYRSAALRTLLFDLKVRAVHRTCYNK